MTTKDIIEVKIAKRLEERVADAKEIGAVIAIELTGEGAGRWVIDCTKEPAIVKQDTSTVAQMTIIMEGPDLIKMVEGEISPQMAFLTGKVKVDGNLGLAIKLGQLLT
jgi:putative sterol carrier protein